MSNIRKAYDVAKNDREDLEGRRVENLYFDKTIDSALVVGCNRAVGITVVNATDLSHKLICYRGPVVPDPSDFSGKQCTYDELYDALVAMIEEGVINNSELNLLEYGGAEQYGHCHGNCAYSQ